MLVFVLAAFCWTKSLLCNVAAFTGMLLYPESTLQLCSSRRFCEVFKDLFQFPVNRLDDVVFRHDAHQSATSVRTTRSFCPDAHQCLEASNSSRLHPSGRNGKLSGRSLEFKKIQCSSASVRTMWLYRPDAIQCLTSIRVSASRQSYGKTAATVRMMCDPVKTMSSISQERAYQVQPSRRQPSWSGQSIFIYGNCVHQFNRPDVSLQGPDAPSLIMLISCSQSATVRMLATVWTLAFKVRTLQALLW
jgi:hypothetical protein